MNMKMNLGQLLAALLACSVWLMGTPVSAGAQRAVIIQTVDRNRIIGQITAVQGPPENPTGITLQVIDQSYFFRFAPRAVVKARSAEAQLEGLIKNDWAAVTVRRIRNTMMVIRLEFDVQPLAPFRLVTGSALRVSPDGRRVLLRLDTGGTHLVEITRQTRYRMDDRPIDIVPTLMKGQTMQILVRRIDPLWIALEINLRTVTPFGFR